MADDEREEQARVLHPCGTPAAYRRHLRHNEEPCEDCKRGHRQRKAERTPRRPRPLAPCGTDAALRRHKARGEELDQECQEYANSRPRASRARELAAATAGGEGY